MQRKMRYLMMGILFAAGVVIEGIASYKPTETYLVIGGSSAYGWAAANNESYLERAFAALSASTGTNYKEVNRALIGGTAARLSPATFRAWVALARPQIVVLSWGLLDDIRHKTPAALFVAAIRGEIQTSLQAGAEVLIVTPPPVIASQNNAEFTHYLNLERETARAMGSSSVVWIGLNRGMREYLRAHGLHAADFANPGDTWHPDGPGHALAGQILYYDLRGLFGASPITAARQPRA